MFPEYRALISRLKKENTRFAALFHEHNILDADIKKREMLAGFCDAETETLKKRTADKRCAVPDIKII